MDKDLERYKRLLEEWDIAASQSKRQSRMERLRSKVRQIREQPSPEPRASEPPNATQNKAQPRARLKPAGEAEEPGRFPKGTILLLNEEELVVYRRKVAGRPFDMVYSLLFDGSVKVEALDLNQVEISEFGELPPETFARLQNEMVWTREMIAENCFSPEDADRIPEPEGRPAGAAREARPDGKRETAINGGSLQRESAEPVREPEKPERRKIVRGQRMTINFGDRKWDAVYWGMDKHGPVVAHKTHGHWSLMHLDLNRFRDSMELNEQPDPALVDEISRDLDAQRGE